MGLLLIFSLYAFSEHSSKQSVLLGCNCSPLMSCSGWQQREAGLGSVCFLRKIPCETWRNGNCRDLDIAYKDIWESEQKCASSECMRHKGCQKQWVLSLHLWQQLDCISCVKQHFFFCYSFPYFPEWGAWRSSHNLARVLLKGNADIYFKYSRLLSMHCMLTGSHYLLVHKHKFCFPNANCLQPPEIPKLTFSWQFIAACLTLSMSRYLILNFSWFIFL